MKFCVIHLLTFPPSHPVRRSTGARGRTTAGSASPAATTADSTSTAKVQKLQLNGESILVPPPPARQHPISFMSPLSYLPNNTREQAGMMERGDCLMTCNSPGRMEVSGVGSQTTNFQKHISTAYVLTSVKGDSCVFFFALTPKATFLFVTHALTHTHARTHTHTAFAIALSPHCTLLHLWLG